MYHFRSTVAGLLTILSLSACGGGTSGGAQTYTPNSALFVTGAAPAALTIVGLNKNTDATFRRTSNLTPPNQLAGGGLTGTASYSFNTGATNSIALSDGRQASLEDNGNRFAFRFGTADEIGIAGVAASTIPSSGTASYTGGAEVVVNDGTSTLTRLNNVTATASFGSSGQVSVVMNNSDGDWVRIDNATISGTSYSGGSLTVSSTFATDPVTSGSLVHEGQFFATNGNELGGVFVLDRTGAGIDFEAQGTYGATQN